MTCEQLRAEEAGISKQSSAAMSLQDAMHGSIIGLPASVVSGNAAQNKVAGYKGQLEAVSRVLTAKKCPSPFDNIVPLKPASELQSR